MGSGTGAWAAGCGAVERQRRTAVASVVFVAHMISRRPVSRRPAQL
ncbi:hypothetical protein [Streptomyces sp. ME18-1-4]|nr:hypothetical protein [Streptomyces sp. ME18-1-4]MDX3242632.1 hypothetical protein [Streptomyces sp. ME18-1-4]